MAKCWIIFWTHCGKPPWWRELGHHLAHVTGPLFGQRPPHWPSCWFNVSPNILVVTMYKVQMAFQPWQNRWGLHWFDEQIDIEPTSYSNVASSNGITNMEKWHFEIYYYYIALIDVKMLVTLIWYCPSGRVYLTQYKPEILYVIHFRQCHILVHVFSM